MRVGRGVIAFITAEAAKASIKKPMVIIMDCGCMMNQEAVEVDLREDRDEPGHEFYFERGGIKFLVSPKIRHLADRGRLGIVVYGGGRFKRLEFSPNKK
jgi:hypothetical protein